MGDMAEIRSSRPLNRTVNLPMSKPFVTTSDLWALWEPGSGMGDHGCLGSAMRAHGTKAPVARLGALKKHSDTRE